MSKYTLFFSEEKLDEEKIIRIATDFGIFFEGINAVIDNCNKRIIKDDGFFDVVSDGFQFLHCNSIKQFLMEQAEGMQKERNAVIELKNSNNYKEKLEEYLTQIEPLEKENEIMMKNEGELSRSGNTEAWQTYMNEVFTSNRYLKLVQNMNTLICNNRLLQLSRYIDTDDPIDLDNSEFSEHEVKLLNNFTVFQKVVKNVLECVNSLNVLSYWGHEYKIEICGKKTIKFKDLTIECLVFLPFNTLLKIVK